ncbi:hypothetical protein BOO86_19415 [Mycobacterium sp. CBMA 234]|uniref:cellulase family glycosylhydrolase n=1 Tax=Mycolicibacterium sp. CBMA 234 TaxID=1918495 RepID=UPI0013915CEB|nr:cellulase family glycosylhydrolase [Mycolicibacterium sp. CBMA 234]MUL66650.1 hypothetical protein [Mycolicibacterium sp. CBMA 234]
MGATSPQIEYTADIVSAPSTIGIADSGLYGETQAQINQTLDTLQSIGVQDVRVFVPWIYVEPLNGVYNWSSIDMVIQAAKARNMGVMAEVASTPVWAAPSGTLPGAGTPDPATYATFVTAVAQRYGTAISAYEIWNEPNYAASSDPIDPVAYAALLKAAYPAIKAVDPSATVVAGALGSVISFGGVTMDPVTFVQQMLAAGAANYFDALSFHPYQESLPFSQGLTVANSPLQQLNAIYQLMTQYGDGLKKIWISEFGASTTDVSQQTQADLIKNLLDTWQTIAYAGPVFIYTAQDGVPGANGFGIWNADWTPKLAVAVVQQAIAQYSSGLLGGVGSVVGGVTSVVAALVQSLSNLVQAIGQAIQGALQQVGHAISALVSAITSALTSALSPAAATPAAATLKTTALKTAAITTKSTTATATGTATTATAATVPTSGATGTTSGTGKPTTTASTTEKSTVSVSASASSTPAVTSAAATSTSPTSSSSSTGATTGTSSASGTGTAADPSDATAATQSESSGTSTKSAKSGTGAASDTGSAGKSTEPGKTGKTPAGATKKSHDGHSGSGSGSSGSGQ